MTTEGYVTTDIPNAGKPVQTWYQIHGKFEVPRPSDQPRPLILLHGGPGIPSIYFSTLAEALWSKHGIPTILYDQFGCGNSTHLPEKEGDKAFWTQGGHSNLFQNELKKLIEHLGISDDYDLLGHSWGGVLAMDFAALHGPEQGIKHLVLASSLASTQLFVDATKRLLKGLPEDSQKTIEKHERDGTVEDPDYEAAVLEFYKRHLCKLAEWPGILNQAFGMLGQDSTVYTTMWGPSEFTCTGALKDWSAIERLGDIKVPKVLITRGEYDEMQQEVVQPILDRVKHAELVVFQKSAHMAFMEEPEEYVKVLVEFLKR